MKRTIFLKTFSGIFLTIIIITVLILFICFQAIKNDYKEKITMNLYNIIDVLTPSVIHYLDNQLDLNHLLSVVSRDSDVRFTIILENGEVAADSEKDFRLMENHNNRPEIIKAKQYQAGISTRYSSSLKAEMIYVAKKIYYNKEVIVVRTSFLMSDLHILTNNIFLNVLKFVLILLLISSLVCMLFAKSLSIPLKSLAKASGQIAEGNFSARVYLDNRDEVGFLANRFNLMAEQLDSQMKELYQKKEELNNIINSINEPLCVINREGKIVLHNTSFNLFTMHEHLNDGYYWEAVKQPQIREMIRNSYEKEGNYTTSLQLGEKHLLINISRVLSKDETIYIIYDVTEIKSLENLKKNLIENVSHELRTPLTAIKGFIETLEPEKENNKRILEIIRRNTERLINITKDLLLLSKLENNLELDVIEFSLFEIAEDVLTMFSKTIRDKKLSFAVIKPEKDFLIKADRFKIEQLIINLVQNSLQYTEQGFVELELNVKDKKDLYIRVSDSGIGISKDHIDRIFDRFYVVNKSRSKKFSGTGLGLSIVKHIVLINDGSISVKSEENKGTSFEIEIPI